MPWLHSPPASASEVEPVAEARQPRVVVTRQRLLEPEDAETFELARDRERHLEVPALVAADPGQDAGLVRVHHQLDVAADGVAYRLDHSDVVPRVRPVEAQLHPAEAFGRKRPHVFGPPLRRPQLTGRAVGRDAVLVTAPELVHGQPGRFADNIPETELDAVDGRRHDLGVLQHAGEALDLHRVSANEVRRHEPVNRHRHLDARVGCADPGDALVSVDLDEGHHEAGLGTLPASTPA